MSNYSSLLVPILDSIYTDYASASKSIRDSFVNKMMVECAWERQSETKLVPLAEQQQSPSSLRTESHTDNSESGYLDSVWTSLPPEITDPDSCPHRLWSHFTANISSQLWALDEATALDRLDAESKNYINNLVIIKGEDCRQLAEDGERQRPAASFVLRSYTERNYTVTFVTSLNFDNLDRFDAILDAWSAAVYIPSQEIPGLLMKLCAWEKLMNRTNVDIHLLMAVGKYYPRNQLRNLAAKNTKTVLSLLCDVDLIPFSYTEDNINGLWFEDETFFESNVLVVPAFETMTDVPMPNDKRDVIELWDQGIVRRHRYNAWPEVSMPTNYHQWKHAIKPYRINYFLFYEPFIVMKTSLVPKYCERCIMNRFENSSLPLEIWALKMEFNVLSDSFLLYYPSNYTALSEPPTPSDTEETRRESGSVELGVVDALRKEQNVDKDDILQML
ncbi:hypothetical protein LSH36_518g02011 [Paralvinella palmiformis]|uniref:Uncharacterized protein n=1 Tax=Paralvinella palmiformis TaxID=53620 RepID=A0AAD9MXR0_9ANNE|nr:hypothetical protein LSH36_518g02011 [Paralvinella palmiformis]